MAQTAKGPGDNGLWRIAKLNGISYLPDVGIEMVVLHTLADGGW